MMDETNILIFFLFVYVMTMDRQMDDSTKIKALMIYCQHWGKEQTRLHKAIQGIQKTNEIIQHHFQGKLTTMDMTKMSFWDYLSNSFLPNMRHYEPYDDLGDIRILYMRVRFSEAIGSGFFNAHIANVGEDEMRRINAIVALPVM